MTHFSGGATGTISCLAGQCRAQGSTPVRQAHRQASGHLGPAICVAPTHTRARGGEDPNSRPHGSRGSGQGSGPCHWPRGRQAVHRLRQGQPEHSRSGHALGHATRTLRRHGRQIVLLDGGNPRHCCGAAGGVIPSMPGGGLNP
jgi:hypothetical protein